ncbi:hypothetical protein M8C21_027403 [Ambrosia artemisiifolia]|uniref:Uncharacterized protein n=1 Tax=Ambrosia artemisiifolia TaxID=4212 RepID=A0AAD5BVG4_AMBAR|nr:hypothetical protein M8C21_027403 [Ambrosia artemisiifolia]
MKRVAFDSHQYVDDRARFKHQTLVQDFMELQQETQAARNNLLALKQKKLTLQAEVRFLRRRHKFLSQNKSATLQEQIFMSTQPARFIKSKKDEVHIGKQKTLHNLPPVGKKKTTQSILSPEFDTILVKQQSLQRAIANRRVRINGPKRPPLHDLRQKDISGSQEHLGQSQTQKPVIDLNQISREGGGLKDHHQPFESPTHGLFKNVGGGSGLESGSGSSGVLGKRKISWQDPVAINSELY